MCCYVSTFRKSIYISGKSWHRKVDFQFLGSRLSWLKVWIATKITVTFLTWKSIMEYMIIDYWLWKFAFKKMPSVHSRLQENWWSTIWHPRWKLNNFGSWMVDQEKMVVDYCYLKTSFEKLKWPKSTMINMVIDYFYFKNRFEKLKCPKSIMRYMVIDYWASQMKTEQLQFLNSRLQDIW